jgi:hypothetical protein
VNRCERDFSLASCIKPTLDMLRASRWLGLGQQLLQALFIEAIERGPTFLECAIESANSASVRCHHAVGFQPSTINDFDEIVLQASLVQLPLRALQTDEDMAPEQPDSKNT